MSKKFNTSFFMGMLWGIGFIMIGLINNKITNGEYVDMIMVIIMFFWLGLGWGGLFGRDKGEKEK